MTRVYSNSVYFQEIERERVKQVFTRLVLLFDPLEHLFYCRGQKNHPAKQVFGRLKQLFYRNNQLSGQIKQREERVPELYGTVPLINNARLARLWCRQNRPQ